MIRILATAALTAGLLIASPVQAQAPDMPTPKWMTTPCAYEDSPNCFWNAEVAGNGDGHSFYSIQAKVGRRWMQCTIYAQTRYGAKHNYCRGN